jgi:uncharacterized protein
VVTAAFWRKKGSVPFGRADLKIVISGASGLIGSELISSLPKDKHEILRLVRKPQAGPGEIRWNPLSGQLDKSALEGVDAVVHLAGENIASGRWTAAKKHRIRESRIRGTLFLARSLSQLFEPPKVLVSVSAIGYYGNRGEEELNEDSSPGKGFLPDLCREWEDATTPVTLRGTRVVIPRIGIVLSASGGALSLMLPVFRMGLGGRIGSGAQYMSWVAMEDLVGIINHAITCESLRGPVNAVSPNPVTNRSFSEILARILARPAFLSLPAFAARIVLGEMANEALLAGAKVSPAKLTQSKYKFKFPELESALRHILKKTGTVQN